MNLFSDMSILRQVSWDDEINRALVIIRNPMSAIPSFFNHM